MLEYVINNYQKGINYYPSALENLFVLIGEFPELGSLYEALQSILNFKNNKPGLQVLDDGL